MLKTEKATIIMSKGIAKEGNERYVKNKMLEENSGKTLV
jgi:hypothetical protein